MVQVSESKHHLDWKVNLILRMCKSFLKTGFLFLDLVDVYENFHLQKLPSYPYLVTGIIGQNKTKQQKNNKITNNNNKIQFLF